MRTFILFLFIFLCGANAFSQTNCNCESEYKFVVNYIEKNLPGFADNVNDNNRKDYELFKDSLQFLATKFSSRDKCFNILNSYVEFFLDAHTSISNTSAPVNEKDTASLNSFLRSDIYLQTKFHVINENELMGKPLESLEGIYYTIDSIYKIGIAKTSTDSLYYGVVLASKALTWKQGQVKLEIQQLNNGLLKVKSYMRNHAEQIVENASYLNGLLTASSRWYKADLKPKEIFLPKPSIFSFKEIDNETNYISVNSFSGNHFALLDSFYKSISAKVYKKPYLIIDVRDNGGGSTNCLLPLVEYFYSKRMVDTTWVQHLSTPDIIARYEEYYKEMKNNEKEFGKKNVESYAKELSELKRNRENEFFPKRRRGKVVFKGKKHKWPVKVAVIYNKYCGSACEDLLFFAMNPSKAILMGERSGGYTGYGNLLSLNTPCMGFQLSVTTTRYSWNQRQYDSKGIPPQYYLKNDEDWVLQAMKILKQGE